MLKLKLQDFGHLMRRADSFEKILMLGKIEGGRRRGWQRMRWLDGIMNSIYMSMSMLWELVKDRESWRAAVHEVTKNRTQLSDWTTVTYDLLYVQAISLVWAKNLLPIECLIEWLHCSTSVEPNQEFSSLNQLDNIYCIPLIWSSYNTVFPFTEKLPEAKHRVSSVIYVISCSCSKR